MSDYTAEEGIMKLLFSGMNAGDKGTGIALIIVYAKNVLGPLLPPSLIKWNINNQNALFGGYPSRWDVAPSTFFATFFGVLMVAHIFIFAVNCHRGHYFWLTLAWIFYCMMKVVAFGLRAYWAMDVTRINAALASSVFHIVPAYYLVSFNLILTQRLFTWRHPVGGSRWLFWNFMFALYFMVFVFVAIIVLASLVPYEHFLSLHSYHQWAKVVQGTAVIIVLYVLTAVALIVLSYAFPPTSKDENLYTYQPWWIESFSPFYFVEKGAAQEAEATFMRRTHNHRHAIRVIAATHHHYPMVKGLSNKRGSLKHNISVMLITFSTALILVEALLRCVVVFEFQPQVYGGLVSKPVVGYLTWGVFEGLVMLTYLFGRVDLRFYRPDILPQEVRAIITALQTYSPSDTESERPRQSFDESKAFDTELSLSFPSSETKEPVANSPPYPMDYKGGGSNLSFEFLPSSSDTKGNDHSSVFRF